MTVKYLYISVFVVLMPQTGVSQRIIILYNHEGTRTYFYLSAIGSFKISDTLMVAVADGTFTAGITPTMGGFSIPIKNHHRICGIKLKL